MLAQDRSAAQVAGVVACANPTGLKLDGGTEWRNVAQFAAGVVIPAAGARVVLGRDQAGFIRAIIPATATTAPTVSATAIAPASSADRQAVITRSACLNTATAILSSGSRARLAERHPPVAGAGGVGGRAAARLAQPDAGPAGRAAKQHGVSGAAAARAGPLAVALRRPGRKSVQGVRR